MCVAWQIRRLLQLRRSQYDDRYDWRRDLRMYEWMRDNKGIIFVDEQMGTFWFTFGENFYGDWQSIDVSGSEGINGFHVQMALRMGVTVVDTRDNMLPIASLPMMRVDEDGKWVNDKPYGGIDHNDHYALHRTLGIKHHGVQFVGPETMIKYCLANGYKILGAESLLPTVYGRYIGV